MSELITFRDLDGGICCVEGDSPLDHWYESVRDVPLVDLDDETLARALRQQLFLDHVVPQAIARLQANPLAGTTYQGELLAAIGTIPANFWTNEKMFAHQTKNIASGVVQNGAEKGVLALAHELIDRLDHWEHVPVPST